jgi:dissimilatory sulfite reductase (desulfoviridin) alpha/beta subunit
MKWTKQAEEAVSRVPFFVRKRVKKKVEEEAERRGATEVKLEHVQTSQKRFLGEMEKEVKGYQIETCFGPGGCPNRAVSDDSMAQKLEEMLSRKNLKSFLKERVQGPLKMHHELRISISDCPNGCSRPQIVDVGLLGASMPTVSEESCSRCGSCIESCKEDALSLPDDADAPLIDPTECLSCGQCIRGCPSGTLREARSGYRILVGGKLGRHPQLARELGGIHSPGRTLEIINRCIDFHMQHNVSGERFGEILNRTGIDKLQNEQTLGEGWILEIQSRRVVDRIHTASVRLLQHPAARQYPFPETKIHSFFPQIQPWPHFLRTSPNVRCKIWETGKHLQRRRTAWRQRFT